jgi:hypothetical protein
MGRGLSYKRGQRRRVIQNRVDRLPEPHEYGPRSVWQCFDPDGNPLNLTARFQSDDEVGDEYVVEWKHGYDCGSPDASDKTKQCTSTCGLWPGPGYYAGSYRSGWPASSRGCVWKCIRTYTPDPDVVPEGALSKENHPDPDRSSMNRGKWKPHGKNKSRKVAGGRSYKVWLDRRLGTDWDESEWDGVGEE